MHVVCSYRVEQKRDRISTGNYNWNGLIVKTFYTFHQLDLELINCCRRTKNDVVASGKVEIQTIRSTFSVDGFVFDGPADGRNVATTASTSSSATPSTTTQGASFDARYDQCVTTCPVSHESPWNFPSFSSFLLFYRGGLLTLLNVSKVVAINSLYRSYWFNLVYNLPNFQMTHHSWRCVEAGFPISIKSDTHVSTRTILLRWNVLWIIFPFFTIYRDVYSYRIFYLSRRCLARLKFLFP